MGDHFRGNSVEQCSNSIHKKILGSYVVLGVCLTSEAKYFQKTVMVPKKVSIVMFNSKTEVPSSPTTEK